MPGYDESWNATFNTEEMKAAGETFYNLAVNCEGRIVSPAAPTMTASTMTSGKGAMWYDATSNASNLDTDDSAMKDNTGYIVAPNDSGWI